MEIPVFSRSPTGEKTPQRLSESSRIIETLQGFMNILRVYTDEPQRERIEKATAKILNRIPSVTKISC
jgi:hypothetical protein